MVALVSRSVLLMSAVSKERDQFLPCIAGFLGVWGASNVTGYIRNAARYAATAPSPGVIYTTTEYSPPAYFEGKMMAVSVLSYRSKQHTTSSLVAHVMLQTAGS